MHLLSEFDFIIGEAQKYSPVEVDNIYDSDLNVTRINPGMTVLSTVTSFLFMFSLCLPAGPPPTCTFDECRDSTCEYISE